MTEFQTTFETSVFGTKLRERVDRARSIQTEVEAILEAVNEAHPGEWQPAVVDEAYHYAALAIRHAESEEFEDYIALAETSLSSVHCYFADVEGVPRER